MSTVTIINGLTEEDLNEIRESLKSVEEETKVCLAILKTTGMCIDPRISKLYSIARSSLNLIKDLLCIKEYHKEYFDTLEDLQETGDLNLLPKLAPHTNSVWLMLGMKEELKVLDNRTDNLLKEVKSNAKFF